MNPNDTIRAAFDQWFMDRYGSKGLADSASFTSVSMQLAFHAGAAASKVSELEREYLEAALAAGFGTEEPCPAGTYERFKRASDALRLHRTPPIVDRLVEAIRLCDKYAPHPGETVHKIRDLLTAELKARGK